MFNAIDRFCSANDLRLLWGDVDAFGLGEGKLKFFLIAAFSIALVALLSRVLFPKDREERARRHRCARARERRALRTTYAKRRNGRLARGRVLRGVVQVALVACLFGACCVEQYRADATPQANVSEYAKADVQKPETLETDAPVEASTEPSTAPTDESADVSESPETTSEKRGDKVVFMPYCDNPQIEKTAYERDSEVGGVDAPRVLSSVEPMRAETSVPRRIQPLEGSRTAQTLDENAVSKSKAYAPDEIKSRPLVSSADFSESVSESSKVGSVAPPSFEKLRDEFVPNSPLVPFSRNAAGAIRSTSYAARGYTQRSNQDLEVSPDDALSVEKINRELSKGYSRVCDAVFTIETHKLDPKTRRPMDETGCGFLFQFDGRLFICTNNHVVHGAESKKDIKIFLPDSSEIYPIRAYLCPEYDLAALEVDLNDMVDREGVNLCAFGDCNQLGEGHFVIAVGSPCLLNKTVTIGNIGGLRRNYNDLRNLGVTSTNMLAEYIQLSAMINPGNSGGPLINARGEVIGVTTASLVTNAPTGIAFAIPINDALRILKTLITEGEWRPTQLGVELVNPEELQARKGARSRGATIKNVHKNSPAELAGMKAGDVVLTFDGRTVEDDVHLARMIALADPSVPIQIDVLRNSERFSLTARPEFKDSTSVAKTDGTTFRR